MKKKSVQQRERGPESFRLIEESVHLVRRMPLAVLARYYAVMALWSFSILFFWAYTSWFAPGEAAILWGALGLAVVYALLKAAQAGFCGRLWEVRTGAAMAPWTVGRFAGLAKNQLRLQAWGLFFVPIAMIVTLPLAWVFGFFQTVSVLGCREMGASELRKTAWKQMLLWPGQQHYALAILAVIASVVWINLASAFYLIPWMANHLLGIENFLGVSGWQMFNTTFVVAVTMLSWMAMDPLIKAYYTLRVFYGQSLKTGDDLRLVYRSTMSRRAGSAAVALVLLLLLPWPTPSTAAESPAGRAVNPAELGKAIENVLEQRDFQWRLRPQIKNDGTEKDGPVKKFIRQGYEIVAETIRSIRSGVRRFENWLKELFPKREESKDDKTSRPASQSSGFSVLRLFLYGLMILVGGLILWVIYLMVRQGSKQFAEVNAAAGGAAEPVNLADENVQAALLPEDGWLALAREQMAKGEWRLALRALYLARLARLGAEGLVVLARFKTNLDYERELRRRAAGRSAIIDGFSRQRAAFECVWYGRELAQEDLVRSWFDELKGVSAI